MSALSRRSFVTGLLGAAPVLARRRQAALFRFVQYHNQTAVSSLHRRLVELWAAVRSETGGRVETEVFALNNNIPGSDPQAFEMLLAGEVQFFTLMGGVIGTVVPAAYVQQLPYAFRSPAHAHEAFDGPLGAYLRQEMAAKGIHAFPVGAFDNGMRQITGNKRPIAAPADLAGMRMRVPSGEMIADTFRAFGAEPVVVNSIDIYDALKSGRVDAQENPLALVELFKLFEVVKFVSMTSHIWSGFNLMAHLPTWRRIPADIQASIEKNAARYVRLQRQDQEAMNVLMRTGLARRGLVFNDVDPAPFRRHLSGFYRTWKARLGSTCWSLLESASGPLA